jgi:NTE family protein
MAHAPIRIAVVLAGAVAKGAYEAGVLQALVRANVHIVRIVAASSGALNGTLLAAAVRARTLPASTDQLVELWRDEASWRRVFHPSLHVLRTLQGVSDRERVLALLRAHVAPVPLGDEIDLLLLVAPLGGVTSVIGDRPATTYESVQRFTGADFATRDALEHVFDAATASSAFPLIFAPVELGSLGPCVDGGAVNNTPVKWALDGDPVDAIVVIATSVELRTGPPPDELHGLALASHLANMLIGERLFRDLHEAEQVNTTLAQFEQLVATGVLSQAQLDQVIAALAWQDRRRVRIIEIRPREELSGSSFSGFFDQTLREQHIAAGRERALEVLGSLL